MLGLDTVVQDIIRNTFILALRVVTNPFAAEDQALKVFLFLFAYIKSLFDFEKIE